MGCKGTLISLCQINENRRMLNIYYAVGHRVANWVIVRTIKIRSAYSILAVYTTVINVLKVSNHI